MLETPCPLMATGVDGRLVGGHANPDHRVWRTGLALERSWRARRRVCWDWLEERINPKMGAGQKHGMPARKPMDFSRRHVTLRTVGHARRGNRGPS
ncbi:hypothetical protein CEP54_013174 [Fusarium duplospermum]|uniref:Uncharacterized protein n=1 Tax=Fusarium duplospermum TaxID=1325734 RepID=A0A428P4H4_9HYPO|nr:hypothetical protein CEP54_013174 [Fusarium duplospermum]